MGADDLCFTPAATLARWVRSRRVSPVELVGALLRRIAVVDPRIHAFVTVDEERALAAAHAAEAAVVRGERLGPLHGVPVSIKDLESTAGLRTTSGSRFHQDHVPAVDGVPTARLRAAGAVVLGKTNTPAFGHKDMSDNLLMPATRNPWHLDRTAGGSSGGAAAAVAAGLGPIAHGGDGAGSIRIPAALCGVFGLKPSFGRVPRWPSDDFYGARSHPGPLARTVRDAALMLSVMAGPDPHDPLSIDAPPGDYVAACDGGVAGLRAAWSPDLGYAPLEPEVRRLVEAAARGLEELGCAVEAADPRWDDPHPWHAVLYRAGIAARFGRLLEERPEWVDESLAQIIELGRRITMQDLAEAQVARSRFYEQARVFMEPYDLLLTAAMPCGAWSWEAPPAEVGGRPVQRVPGGRWPLMFPFNLTGWPAAAVPCGFTAEGLPVALQVVAGWHRDEVCFRTAAALEAARPWAQCRPGLTPS